MIEQRWCTTDGTSWTLSHGKYWAHIELSFDNTNYFASTGSLKDRPPEELSWDELNEGSWAGEFDCLKKAKAACIQHITKAIDEVTKSLQVSPYEGIFDRENYDDQS
jgi:hypothetical protein